MGFKLRIGSRPSALAMAQAEMVRSHIVRIVNGVDSEIVAISTSGDRMKSASLAQVGGKGLFIKELEQALADGRIDVAVHSMKDLPAVLGPAYRIVAVPERENPRDIVVTRDGTSLRNLAHGARLGTSSARRRFEALRIRPDLNVMPLRGNVDTRLGKLAGGEFDAVILALAGLKRLGRLKDVRLAELDEHEFVPSAGQGALAIEAIADRPLGGSDELEAAVAALDDAHANAEVTAERAFLATIGASCVSPVGVKATADGESLALHALLFSLDGVEALTGEIREPCPLDAADLSRASMTSRAAAIGTSLGHRMLENGADRLLGHG